MTFIRTTKTVVILSASLMLTSCANFTLGNLFSHYSAQISEIQTDVKAGRYDSANAKLNGQAFGGAILSQMETGRVAFLAQDYPKSMQAFKASDNAWQVLNQRATVSLTNSANQIGSLATNDNLVDYQPADYELAYLHLYLGLNYVQKNDLEGALVEMRRANQVQEQAQKTRAAELTAAQNELKANGLEANLGSVLSHYPAPKNKLQAVQNAYLLYLSGLLYEAGGQPNDAYIDYKRALAVYPDNNNIIQATMRLAKKLGMRSDLSQLTSQYGKLEQLSSNQGELIILEERDVVSPRLGWDLSLPVYGRSGWRYYSVALPTYRSARTMPFVAITLNGKALSSSLITDTNLMARNDLHERMPYMLINQAIRMYAKDQLRREAVKQDESGAANVVMNIWNIATEQPDTRSWHTLPAQVYSSLSHLNEGEYSLNLGSQSYPISIKSGQRTLVWLSRQGSSVVLWQKSLGKI